MPGTWREAGWCAWHQKLRKQTIQNMSKVITTMWVPCEAELAERSIGAGA